MSSSNKIEGSDSKNNDDACSEPPTSDTTSEEASKKLEDHHCAICDNVLVNACRIGCGHTFCRYCLTVHKEKKNERGKPTCFICDAAVTEISHNDERDKEIAKLYTLLPVNERLRRARFIAERKEDEEKFESAENVFPQQEDEACGGGGDRSSFAPAVDESRHLSHEGVYEGHSDEEHSGSGGPTLYYSPGFVMWTDEETLPHVSHQFEENDPGFCESYNVEDSYFHTDEDVIDFGSLPERDQSPITIHHTVQHIFHTVEVRNSAPPQQDHVNQSNVHRSRFPSQTDSCGHSNTDYSQTRRSSYVLSRTQRNNHSPQNFSGPFICMNNNVCSGYNQPSLVEFPSHYGTPFQMHHQSSQPSSSFAYNNFNSDYRCPSSSSQSQNVHSTCSTRNDLSDHSDDACGSTEDETCDCSSCHSCGCECESLHTDRPSSHSDYCEDCCFVEINPNGCSCGGCDLQSESESIDDGQTTEEETITVNVTIPLRIPADRITIRTTERERCDRRSFSYSGGSSSRH